MGFLDDLRKRALDVASRAYDEANQWDGGKNWNQRTVPVRGQQAQRSGVNYLADMTVGNTARLVNTANAGVVQPIVGGLQGKSAQQLSRDFDRSVYTDKGGLLNVGTFFPSVQDYQRTFKDPVSFTKGFTAAGVGTATEVAPIARGASLLAKPGLSAGQKILRGAAEGAVYGGAGTAAQQQLYNGQFDAKGIATGAALGAGMGGGIPAAGVAAKAGVNTAKHASRIGYENTLKNIAETADTINVNQDMVPAPTKALDKQRVLAYANKIANGDKIDPIVVTRGRDGGVSVLDGEHRAEAYKALGLPVPTKQLSLQQAMMATQGGYVRIPGQPTELMVTHNLSADNLAHAQKLGGIPQASVAIVDPKKHALEGFGEITLIGNEKLVNPKAPRTHTFASDVYSPRQPRSKLTGDRQVYENLRSRFGKEAQELNKRYLGFDSADSLDQGAANESAVMLQFLRSKGKKIKNPQEFDRYEYSQTIRDAGWEDEFNEWARQAVEEAGAKPTLFAGTTNTGRHREIPETMENILKLMRKDRIRAGEKGFGGAASLGNIRARIAPQFRSLKEIVENKHRLTDSETMEATKALLDNKAEKIRSKLDGYSSSKDSNSFMEYDSQMDAIGDYLMGDRSWFDQKFPSVPQNIIKELDAFKKELQESPTEYFESVVDRAVQLNEFEKALVPMDAPKDVINRLNKEGIQPVFYKEGERQSLLEDLMRRDNFERFPNSGDGFMAEAVAASKRRLKEGGYAKFPFREKGEADIPAYVNEYAQGISKPEELVDEAVKYWYNHGKETKGGQMLKTEGVAGESDAYRRISEHNQFYRDFYKANKKAPTKADYKAEIERQIKAGGGSMVEPDMATAYQLVKNRVSENEALAQQYPRVKEAATISDEAISKINAATSRKDVQKIHDDYQAKVAESWEKNLNEAEGDAINRLQKSIADAEVERKHALVDAGIEKSGVQPARKQQLPVENTPEEQALIAAQYKRLDAALKGKLDGDTPVESTKPPKPPVTPPTPTKIEDLLDDPLFSGGAAKPPANAFQDTLPSGKRPDSIKEIVKNGGNPLYHDTDAKAVVGILDSGEIRPSQAPFSQIANQGKRVSTTRNFDNYSRYGKAPYRFVIDESKTGQKAIPDNREEFESIFNKPVKSNSIHSLAIDTTNPALIDDMQSGKLAEVIAKAKEKGIKIEAFEGKILPNEAANAEIQKLTKEQFSSKFGGQLGGTPPKKPLPTTPAPDQKLSRFANRTVQNSDEVSKPLKKLVREEKVSYDPHTNEGRLAASEEWLKGKSTDKAFSESIDKLATGKMNDQDVVNAISIAKKLDGSGKEDDLIKATEIYGQLSEHLTKKGQEVQAASLLSNRTPEGLRYGAQRDLQKGLKEKGKDITPEQINEIKRLVDDIKQFDPKSDDAAFARYNLAKYVSSQIPTGISSKIVNFWRASLLTAPTTTGGNILGNTGEAVMRKALVNPVATAADMALGAFTGKRSFSASGGFTQGAKEGSSKLGRFMKTGYDERNALSKYDTKELNYGDSGIGKGIGMYVNGVYRTMSLADQPFWYGARTESLKGIAKVEAINKGLKGDAKNEFIENFMKNPPKQAMEQATKDAKYSTFQDETMLGTAASSLKMGLRQKSDTGGAVADFFIPFTQVPASIATRVVQRTPVGTGIEVAKQIIRVKSGKPFDQRAMAKAIGEGSVGTAIFAGGYALANSGLLTFGYPEDPKERELWEAEGKQPYSVRVGDRWYSLNYLQPFGTLLAIGGEVANAVKDGAEAGEAISRGIATAGQAVMNQSFLKGISGVLEAIDDPKRYAENYVSNTAGSVVPNFVRSFARASDPLQRDQKGALEGIQGSFPGLRQQLPAKQDMFGQDVPAKDNFANQYFNPLRPSKVRGLSDEAVTELRRLQDAGEGIMPSAAKKNAFKDHELTREQVAELNRKTGSALKTAYHDLIGSVEYDKLDDAGKKKALERVNDTVYGAIKNEYGQKLGVTTADKLTGNQKRYLAGKSVNFTNFKRSGGGSSSEINGSLASAQVRTLEDYDTMTTEEREKLFRTENDAEFKYLEAKYNNDKANGAISGIQDIKRRKELGKAQIGSKFSKDTRELYSLSKADLYAYVNQAENGEKLAEELLAYDQALYDAGLVSYLKFKTGLAPSTRTASRGRSSGGRKSSGSRAKGSAKAKADAEKDMSDEIALTGSLSRRVANAKVGANQRASFQNKISRQGIKAYKKAEKNNVTVRRNIA